jgi:rhodanese-related sulfurtransferase
MRKSILSIITLALFAQAQQPLSVDGFERWIEQQATFLVIDTRVDNPVDSLLYPALRTSQPAALLAMLGCRHRLLLIGEQSDATSLIEGGFAAESLFVADGSLRGRYRFGLGDTLSVALLTQPPQGGAALRAPHLRSLIAGAVPHRIIDVRTPAEFAEGAIPGGCNIPWPDSIQTAHSSLPRNETVVVYCRSGSRAAATRNFLISSGFNQDKVFNFGGYSNWSTVFGVATPAPSADCHCLGVSVALRRQFFDNRGVAPFIVESRSPQRLLIRMSAPYHSSAVELVSLDGRLVARSRPDSAGRVAVDLGGKAAGALLVRVQGGRAFVVPSL